jgi:hypothetical protein
LRLLSPLIPQSFRWRLRLAGVFVTPPEAICGRYLPSPANIIFERKYGSGIIRAGFVTEN